MKTLIAANWKMHGDMGWRAKPAEFRSFFSTDNQGVECLICPPSYLIPAMADRCDDMQVSLGAQNCHSDPAGAFTGEMSAAMVADAGAAYVILGHSERRALFGETDEIVAAKTKAAQAAGLQPIVCIGESQKQRVEGAALDVVALQLNGSIPGDIKETPLVVAYEPVWAIGTGLTPTLGDIEEMHKHIRALLKSRFGSKYAKTIRILYGGSVKPANAKQILSIGDVNGALIGGASLDMRSLAEIAKAV